MLKIGFSEVSITPDVCGVGLEGQFYERISEYVETPVTVTAMAMENGEEQAIICSCDLVNIPSTLMERVRYLVADKAGEIKPMSIMIGATHTHTSLKIEEEGPIVAFDVFLEYCKGHKPYSSAAAKSAMSAQEAHEFVAHRIADAIVKAWECREKSYISNELGYGAVGWSRRAVYADGSAKMYGNTHVSEFDSIECSSDNGVELLYVFDEKKNFKGVVANICCPAQIVELHSFISSDYWGKVKKFVREKLGQNIYIVGLCGAGGDQAPRDIIRSKGDWSEPMYNIEGTNILGKAVANIIVDCFEKAVNDIKDTNVLIHKISMLDMPLRKVSENIMLESESKVKNYIINSKKEELTFEDYQELYCELGNIGRYRAQQNESVITEEIHVLRVGDIVFATNPFELFIDFGNQIKARSKAEQTFIMQLSCGARGYLPTKRAQSGGHYSAYVTSGFTGFDGGKILVEKTVDMINSSWNEE